jgi:hypothetical protein
MAMLLVVATTEATDPMRVSVSLQTTVNVVESLSVRLLGATRGSNELRVRIIGEGGK